MQCYRTNDISTATNANLLIVVLNRTFHSSIIG